MSLWRKESPLAEHRGERTIEDLLARSDWLRALARQLVGQGEADDLVQESWLVALRKGPRGPQAFSAWMKTTLRRRAQNHARGEARRRRREQETATQKSVTPPPDELHERLETHKLVVAAVQRLEEPYRSAIVHRFFDGLSTSEVARREAIAEATVRSRLQRALTKLRSDLDREFGDEHFSGVVALCFLAYPEGQASAMVGAGSGVGLGGIVLGMGVAMKSTLAGVTILGAMALGVWQLLPEGETEQVAPAAVRGAPIAVVKDVVPEAEPQDQRLAETEPDRVEPSSVTEAPATAPGFSKGRIFIEVVWADDHSPVPHCRLELFRAGDTEAETARPVAMGYTDNDGREDLSVEPGEYRLQIEDVAHTVSVSEPTTELKAEMAGAGFRVFGRVLDSNSQPVAVASVRLDYTEVTRTGDSGEYRVRFYPGSGAQRLWAWHPDHAPSRAYLLRGPKDHSLELDLIMGGPGATLEGRVVTSAGAPVASAQVTLGRSRQGPRRNDRGPDTTRSPARFVVSAADGRFRAEGLAAGRLSVRVHSDAGILETVVRLQGGETTQHAFELADTTRISGVVRTEDNDLVPHAVIRISKKETNGRYRGVGAFMADESGRFDQPGIPTGLVRVVALHPGHLKGGDEREFEIVSGTTTTWDPRLPAIRLLEGRVVDSVGNPLPGLQVSIEMPPGDWWIPVETDDQGRFSYDRAPVRSLSLDVREQGSVVATLEDVVPDGQEITITVLDNQRPRSFIVGRVLDPHGAPLDSVEIHAFLTGHSATAFYADPETGEFRIGPLSQGRYDLRVRADGRASANFEASLPFDDTVDMGDMTIADPAVVRVFVRDGNGVPVKKAFGWVEREPNLNVSNLVADGQALKSSKPLSPGAFVVNLWAPGWANCDVPVVLRSGQTAECVVNLLPGQSRTFVVPGGPDAAVVIRATRPNGDPLALHRLVYEAASETWRVYTSVPVETFRMEIETRERTWSQQVTIEDTASDDPIVLAPGN